MTGRPALVLIDLQRDFLELPGIEPHPSSVIAGATRLLEEFRERGLPVIHVRTQTALNGSDSMPHWVDQGLCACVAGSAGYEAPRDLRPRDSEWVVDKTWFSAFSAPAFEERLHTLKIQTLVIAGLFIQTCLRQTALDGYQKGFRVYLARDASGSHDPLHAALTLNYLAERAMTPLDTAALLDAITRKEARPPLDGAALNQFVLTIRPSQMRWAREPLAQRLAPLRSLATSLEREKEILAQIIVAEVNKPITFARAEVDRAISLLQVVTARAQSAPEIKRENEGRVRYHPRGIVALITPWNNPLAIPMGKLAPALAYGNAVLWKPSPHAAKIARALLPLMAAAGIPDDLVTLVEGDERRARKLIAAGIDAVAFTGSSQTGWSIIAQAAARLLPIQAELGGNNAAIVSRSADLAATAAAIAEGAFGFAGQRCTSNRRVIVLEEVYDAFLNDLQISTRELPSGAPTLIETRVTPMISRQAAQAVAALIVRARAAGYTVLEPQATHPYPGVDMAAFHPPTLVLCDEPSAFIVQEESFGPILVVQKARDFTHALELLNSTPYGLVASLFSREALEQERFIEEAEAGIVKLNTSTVNAGVDLPFTGWKHSGYGDAEHGEANAAFFTKRQAIYG